MSQLTEEDKSWISKEIQNQVRCLKKKIISEILGEVNEDNEKYAKFIDKKINNIAKTVKVNNNNILKEVDQEKNKVSKVDNSQFIMQQIDDVKNMTKQLILDSNKQLTASIYSKVIGEVNNKIVPRMKKNEQWMNYHTQNDHDVINDYRMGVMKDHGFNKHAITDGTKKSSIIAPDICMAFDDDNDYF
jgi:hypothetical protein